MKEIDQELFDAVDQGNLDKVASCINRGANIRARYYKHSNSLLGYIEAALALILPNCGDTPLDNAREKGYTEIVLYLLDEETGLLCKEKNVEKLLQAYEEMFDIQKDKFGCDHPLTLLTQYNIAIALDWAGTPVWNEPTGWNKALRIYQEVFEKRRDVLGRDHPVTLETHSRMEKLREKLRQKEEEIAQYEQEKAERQHFERNVAHSYNPSDNYSIADEYDDMKRRAEAYARDQTWAALAGNAQGLAYYQKTEHLRRAGYHDPRN